MVTVSKMNKAGSDYYLFASYKQEDLVMLPDGRLVAVFTWRGDSVKGANRLWVTPHELLETILPLYCLKVNPDDIYDIYKNHFCLKERVNRHQIKTVCDCFDDGKFTWWINKQVDGAYGDYAIIGELAEQFIKKYGPLPLDIRR